MFKKFTRTLAALLLPMALAGGVSAQETATTTPSAVPSNLHVYSTTGHFYIGMPASGCSQTKYVLDRGHRRFDTIVSMALAAQLAGKPIVVRFDGCNAIDQGQIVGVYLP